MLAYKQQPLSPSQILFVQRAMRINKRIIPYELQLRKCIRNEKVSNKARMKRGQMRRHCMDRFYCY